VNGLSTKEEILNLLRENGGFVSGEELSERFKVSRTAVWKAINALRDEGYTVQSATNRGYKLAASPDAIKRQEIESGLKTNILARNIYCYDSIDSTNDEAKRQAMSGAPNGSLFIAEQQSGGKGRLGRTFLSPPGTGLWFSVLLRSELIPQHITNITLQAGLAVCKAIRELTCCPAMIKWPNDVVIGSKKVCGILTEMAAEIDRVNYIVVGIGINVNIPSFPEELSAKATSLLLETGENIPRIRLLQEVLSQFEKLLTNHSDDFLGEYKTLCVSLNRKVGFSRNNTPLTGTAADISPEGELLVRMKDGSIVPVSSGEVTVQGIYGQ
jgi:BirA family biotin operon repressor/biotin-[acetyl-CoA-carboxylase] ligase